MCCSGIVGALVNPDLLLDNDFEPPTTLVRKADESNDDGGVLGGKQSFLPFSFTSSITRFPY